MEKMIQIPEWQLKEIEDTLRLANNIHHSQRKETCFDRCVCKAWDFAKRALANAGTSEKDLRVCEVIPRFFDPERNKPLPSKNDITFSDDVFIIDEDGMHGLAYYSFEDCQWKFHTDTLVDYNEVGHETKWKWYYPTVTVKDAF